MEDQLGNFTTEPSHERLEIDVRPVWITAAVIVAVVVASYFLVVGIMRWRIVAEGATPSNQSRTPDPNWDEQNPLQRLRIREHQQLTQYEWVDQSTGIARIPVERAMELVAENGLPPAMPAGTGDNSPSRQQPAQAEVTPPPQEGDPP